MASRPSPGTVNRLGPEPSLAAATLFDEIAREEGGPRMQDIASDHPVTPTAGLQLPVPP